MNLHSNEIILFQRGQNLDLTKTFRQVSAHRVDSPHFHINHQGYLTYSGDGDFGVLYTKETYHNFLFEVRLIVPSGSFQYVNSGLYFRHKDPLDLDLNLPQEIRELVTNRTAGFIADWSSYEVQLLAGEIQGDPINKQNGAFYNIPLSLQEVREYRFLPGETYDVRLKVLGQNFDVYMKWQGQSEFIHVSSLKNPDTKKSSKAGHIGLQSYYSNGQEVQAFLFERVSITPLP